MNRFGKRNNDRRQYSRDGTKMKIISNKVDLSEEMFPCLSTSIATTNTSNTSIPSTGKLMSKSVWSPQPVKEEEESDNLGPNIISNIDVNNSNNWNGIHWTGPVIIRGNINSSKNDKNDPTTSRIEYSRDNINWQSSWEETFSEAQLEQYQLEKEQEDYEDIYRIMDEYSRRIEDESERYYYEVGELDDYAKAVIEREQYEEYAKQFDNSNEIESVENNEGDDEEGNLEEDY
jgi:hypothetical protein